MALILIRLSKQGTSREIKKQVLIRYTLLFLVFLPQYIQLVQELTNTGSDFAYIEGSVTVFIALVRIQEPLILKTLKESFCKPKIKVDKKVKDDSLCAFLKSSSNVEYVYFILVGICGIMKSSKSGVYDDRSRRPSF